MKEYSYHEKMNIDNSVKLKSLIATLPRFTAQFFRGIEPTTSSRTRIAYAYDLKIFFNFLKENNPTLKSIAIEDLKIELLDDITPLDIEEYLDYIKYYNNKDGKEHINNEQSVMRKLASLRTFYKYHYKKQLINTNPAMLIDMPKLREKEIIRLEIDEVAKLLDIVENGSHLTKSQQKYHNKTKVRDLALLTLLLGTGIRVSECVGLDIDNVDLENNGIKIIRKGGAEAILYFSMEVQEALVSYIDERKRIIPEEGHINALFLSMQNKRLSVRAVENMVKKYSNLVTKLKTITPHKLRSTYGTSLYRETGDIYLVADVLGHKDVNTTKRHYAALEESRRRSAANAVVLREKQNDEK